MNPVIIASVIGGAAVGFIAGFVAGKAGGNAPAAKSGRNTKSGSGKSAPRKTGNGIELYVGNLSYDIDDAMLKKEFAKHGKVLSARVIKNNYNNRSRGYGFVEMGSKADADKAIKAMHAKELLGRKLVVNVARSNSRVDD